MCSLPRRISLNDFAPVSIARLMPTPRNRCRASRLRAGAQIVIAAQIALAKCPSRCRKRQATLRRRRREPDRRIAPDRSSFKTMSVNIVSSIAPDRQRADLARAADLRRDGHVPMMFDNSRARCRTSKAASVTYQLQRSATVEESRRPAPGYSTAHGGVVEGERMLVGYIHKPRGTGSRMHRTRTSSSTTS